jgi:Fic family protein
VAIDLIGQATSTRAGSFVRQPSGYAAFVPAPLPPIPSIEVDTDLLRLLSTADLALGRLDGLVQVIPDPDLFVGMYVRREAVLSSQIEGTQSTLEDLLEVELEPAATARAGGDVHDIVNYIAAMHHALDQNVLPLSLRLIREIHGVLLRDGRGASATPGEFRTSQNWIGPQGASLTSATFVPPTIADMHAALNDFELFLHADARGALLIDIGLAHGQFETIHPFIDGNGRVGRLLITFLLVHHGVLRQPLLYLSHFFKLNRPEYYDRLTAIRLHGDWEGWLRFFLRGVAETAAEATATAESIFELRERHRAAALEAGPNGLRLLSLLFRRPVLNVGLVTQNLEVSFPTANRLVARFVELGILREVTGQRRSRVFRYEQYVSLFDDPAPSRGAIVTTEVTGPHESDSQPGA